MTTYRDQSNHQITILAVSASSSGNNTLLAGVSGKKIYVTEVMLIPDADSVKVRFKSGSTNLTGQMNLSVAGNGFVIPATYKPDGTIHSHLITNAGEALILNLDAAVAVNGFIHYYVE